jgi:DNA-binding CsgD family transcriptional regulator
VVVLGDAGTGKSRLLDELRRSLDDGDRRHKTVFALGHCVLGADGALPCAAILELLDDLRDAADTEAVARAIDSAHQLLVGATDAPAAAGTTADPHPANPIRRLEAVLEAVHAVAHDRRAVLAIDDVQWADAGTIDLVAFLARRLARSGTVLLLAYREREARMRPEIARCLADLEAGWLRDRVSITSLGRREALELVDAIAGAPVARGRATRLAERAGGNPLFIEQLVAADAEAEQERAANADGVEASGSPAADQGRPTGVDRWGLSDREREVLTLVGAGRTNREIGEALFITDKTASSHVTHILDKLGVDSRVEAALAAAAAGLVPGPESGPTGDTFQGSPDDDPERQG